KAPESDALKRTPTAYALGDVCEVLETLGPTSIYQQAEQDFRQLFAKEETFSGATSSSSGTTTSKNDQERATTLSKPEDLSDRLQPHNLQTSRDFCREQCFIIRIVDGVVHLIESKGSFQSRHQITWTLIQRVVEKYWQNIEVDAGPVEERNLPSDGVDEVSSLDASSRPVERAAARGRNYDLELVIDTSDGLNTPRCKADSANYYPDGENLASSGRDAENTSQHPQQAIDEAECHRGSAGLTLLLAKRFPDGAGILYPDFSFHSWPEAECPEADLRGSHGWDTVTRDLLQVGDAHSFADKIDAVFWRGADTSPLRREVVKNIHRIRTELETHHPELEGKID
ncbi:unnamed protein product, partial [Amoebophrya sp. A120]